MLFANCPKLNLGWLTPVLVVLVVVVSIALKFLVPLTDEHFAVLLLNLVGAVLLASAFELHIQKRGDGGWWESFKFAIKKFPEYNSAPAFDFVRL